MRTLKAQSGSFLVYLSLGVLFIVVAVSVFLVLRQTGFMNRASYGGLVEESLSVGLLEMSAKKQTWELLGSQVPSQKGSGNDTASQIALSRKNTLLALIQKDPGAFLSVALPKKLRDTLSSLVQKNVEEETTVRGTLQILISDDFKNAQSRQETFLLTENGKKYSLFFPGTLEEQDRLGPGVRMTVKGYLLGSFLVARSLRPQDIVVEAYPTVDLGAQSNQKKLAVILLDFKDQTNKSFTKKETAQWLFKDQNSAAAYYKEVTYGKWGLTGDVYGWFTLDVAHSECNYSDWGTLGLEQAKKAGLIEDNYTNIMFVISPSVNCDFAGIAELKGKFSWIAGAFDFHNNSVKYPNQNQTVIHELGHNFGAHHANGYWCVDETGKQVAISNNCTSLEYKDPYDVMGNDTRQLNSFHRGQLKIINGQDTTVAKKSGVYTLRPLGTDIAAKEVIRIPRKVDSVGKIIQSYYLEYRPPSGFFDKFNPNSPMARGITLRLAANYKDTYSDRTYLIDTHPTVPSVQGTHFVDAPLLVNETFEDTQFNIKVKVLSVSPAEAKVAIDVDATKCTRQKPQVSFYPSNQWGHAAEPLSYYLYIVNTDSPACPTGRYTLEPTLEAGWSQSQNIQNPIDLPAGSSREIALTITSNASSKTGPYTITETIKSEAGPLYSQTVSALYNLYGTDTTAPQVTILDPGSDGKILSGNVSVKAKVSDDVTVKKVEFFIDNEPYGSFSDSGPNYSATLPTPGYPNGNHVLMVRAYDLTGNKGEAVRSIQINNP